MIKGGLDIVPGSLPKAVYSGVVFREKKAFPQITQKSWGKTQSFCTPEPHLFAT